MKTWQNLKFVPALILSFLVACAKDLPEKKEIPIPIVSALSVLETSPKDGETNVPLDTQFTITFDQKVDAYSAIPQNFEIWTSDGARVGVEKLVSTRFIKHPDFDDFYVSQITVSLNGTYLLPHTKYYFLWGEGQSENGNIDQAVLGIQSLFGARLSQGGISFTTGDQYHNLEHSNLEVLAISPGHCFSRGKSFEFNAGFGDLLNRSSEESYITWQKRSPITIHFSEPIVDRQSELDLIQNGFRELQPTPIEDFGNMIVMVLSRDISFNELFNSVRELSWNDWISFRSSIQDRLQGKVYSKNSRKTLVFELDEYCEGNLRCEYPEWPGSVVVIVMRDLKAWQTNKQLLDNLTICGFIHSPGFTINNPISFDFGPFSNQGEGS